MASSDEEEAKILLDCVTNYYVLDSHNAPVSFSVLPLHWTDHGDLIGTGDSPLALLGTTDGGLQSVYKEVIAWKLELSYAVPEVYMLSKEKAWIKLQKPRKSYGGIVKGVLIVICCLHFVKRNVRATGNDILKHLLKFLRSCDLVEPLENCLSAHLPLIRSAVAKDKDLARSKYLESFLMKIENSGRREALLEDNRASNKSKFIVSDDDDEDFDDEPEEVFDSVCAFCDNGGDVLACEGQCLRSFHPTVCAGDETCCESLGFENAAQYEAIPTFLCDNCKHQKHQCFDCGMLGSSDKSSAVEVFPCASATCGHFYHPECVANLLYPSDATLAKQLKSQIAAGESFTCPIHKCRRCQQGENKDEYELQFAICRRCPKAYHRKCLPKKIAFNASADGTIEQRAWDNLLPQRILMYCMKHKILPRIETPKRDHLLFPYIERKRDQEGKRIDVMQERRSNAFGNLKEHDTEKTSKVIERRYSTVGCGDTALVKGNSSTMHKQTFSCHDNKSISGNLEQSSNMVRSKSPYKDMQVEQRFTSESAKKTGVSAPPEVDADIPSIETPKRDHLLFPHIKRKRDQEGKRIDVMQERRSTAFGNLKEDDTEKMPKVIERRYSTIACGDTVLVKGKSSTMHKQTFSCHDNKSISGNLEQPSNIVRSKSPYKDMQVEQRFTSEPVKKTVVSAPPEVDADMKTRILNLVEDTKSSCDLEELIKEKKKRCTNKTYTPQYGLDKTMTIGKVEASVKAVKEALKILEDGGSVEDAKAICEPNVLNQLIRWKVKLQVFLAPFLHGARYTSFGRHFTKVVKLQEIVDRLHWYVEDGDTIVDFCCGSNDFSCCMKEKLDTMGKRCKFKNYDLITPKNSLGFEKRDWFTVPVEELPDGSRLVMGLNPPFGVHASLANKFINHALKFQPKLIILIVPEETKRLDCKSTPYDLIWEERDILSGKSFYLPGSVDIRDQPLDDWNVKPPPLSLWSRPDWTANHMQVAKKHYHIYQKQPHATPCNYDNTNTTSHALYTHPSHLGQHPGFGPPQLGLHANTSVPYGPYGNSGPVAGYDQSGHYANTGVPYGGSGPGVGNGQSGNYANTSVPYGPYGDSGPVTGYAQSGHYANTGVPYGGSGPGVGNGQSGHYANTSVPYGPYGDSGPSVGYTQSGHNANTGVPYGGSGPGVGYGQSGHYANTSVPYGPYRDSGPSVGYTQLDHYANNG